MLLERFLRSFSNADFIFQFYIGLGDTLGQAKCFTGRILRHSSPALYQGDILLFDLEQHFVKGIHQGTDFIVAVFARPYGVVLFI